MDPREPQEWIVLEGMDMASEDQRAQVEMAKGGSLSVQRQEERSSSTCVMRRGREVMGI